VGGANFMMDLARDRPPQKIKSGPLRMDLSQRINKPREDLTKLNIQNESLFLVGRYRGGTGLHISLEYIQHVTTREGNSQHRQ
jgi:hypothetical protein